MQDGRSQSPLLCWCCGQIEGRNSGRAPRDIPPMRDVQADATAAESCLHSAFSPCSQRKAGLALGYFGCILEGLNLGFCFDSGLLFHVLLSVCSPSECYPTGILWNLKC